MSKIKAIKSYRKTHKNGKNLEVWTSIGVIVLENLVAPEGITVSSTAPGLMLLMVTLSHQENSRCSVDGVS